MGTDPGKQFTAVPDIDQALAQQGAQGALLSRIDVGGRDQVGAQEVGDLLGVNAVVLVLAAVNGLEVERMGQDEMNASLGTGIREPIPAKHAFGADRQIVAIGSNELQEVSEVIVFDVGVDELFAVPIHEADIHLPGMEINSAVELGGRSVVFHG